MKVFLLIFWFYIGCSPSDRASKEEKNSLLYAYLVKSAECGTSPGFFPFIEKNPSDLGVNLCMLAVLNLRCPFLNFPLECLEYFRLDVPNVGPKLEGLKL